MNLFRVFLDRVWDTQILLQIICTLKVFRWCSTLCVVDIKLITRMATTKYSMCPYIHFHQILQISIIFMQLCPTDNPVMCIHSDSSNDFGYLWWTHAHTHTHTYAKSSNMHVQVKQLASINLLKHIYSKDLTFKYDKNCQT